MESKILMILAFLIVGCGGGEKTYITNEANITEEPETPMGDVIIVDSSDNTTITKTDTTITIECGGTCGDINIGNEVEKG